MEHSLQYEQLLAEYRELQLRVTRFSAIEQELINTRDQLDQELELYKRLQRYSSQSLEVKHDAALFGLITEAIIDILEIECAIVYYHHRTQPELSRVFTEGFRFSEPLESIGNEIRNAASNIPPKGPALLNSSQLTHFRILAQFEQALVSRFVESDLNYEVYFLGANSRINARTYPEIQERHQHIFGVFSHQMQAVLANRKRSDKIEEQILKITRSENELRKLSLIATKAKSGVIIADSFGRIEWVNDAFTKITGYALHEVIGRKPKDFLQGKETTDDKRSELSTALAKKEDIEIVLVNRDKSGKPYHNQLEIVSVFDEAGKHINFIAIQKDITDEVNFRQEILQMNSRFELISNFSKIGIWEWIPGKDRLTWNNVLYQINGLDFGQFIGNDLYEAWKKQIHPDDTERVLEEIETLKNGSSIYIKQEYRIVRFNDHTIRYIQALIIAERKEEGALHRLIGSVQDITPMKQLQQSLEDAIIQRDENLVRINLLKSFYERILQYSPSTILVFDQQLRLQFTNQNAEQDKNCWNLTDTMLQHQLVAGEQKSTDFSCKDLLDKIHESVEQRKLTQLEKEREVADGTTRQFLHSIMPYFSDSGELENVIVIGTDISEIKQFQRDMLQKNEELRKINLELDHFVYSISHDLRSPLLSIKGIVAMVLQTPDLSEQNRTFLNMMLTSVTRLDGTIQEILEYSRNSRFEIQTTAFNLIDLIQSVFDDLKFGSVPAPQIEFQLSGDPIIQTDKARMGVLLKNIISNCIKYARKEIPMHIQVTLTNSRNKPVTLEIADNGEGIAPKHLDRVFEMFYRATTSSTGTGLGLYICREITNKLGGSINIHSMPETGTTVTISLPNSTHEPC